MAAWIVQEPLEVACEVKACEKELPPTGTVPSGLFSVDGHVPDELQVTAPKALNADA